MVHLVVLEIFVSLRLPYRSRRARVSLAGPAAAADNRSASRSRRGC